MPYFFLSYATADNNPQLETFYEDLADAVRGRTGLRSEDVGFHDRSSIELGDEWSSVLVDALATSRVFVALCSPSYFGSTYCGKEWQLFSDLVHRRRPHGTNAGGCLVPITWIPTRRNLPEVARRLQYSHADLGEVYRQEGLQFLARLRRFRDDYQEFVTRLAERIVTVGESAAAAPPLSVPSLEDTPSAFVRASTNATVVNATGSRPAGGPRHVNFVLVAAGAQTMTNLRRDTSFYGPMPQDWAPYKPQSPDRICVFAQSIACKQNLTSALDTAESSIMELLARARQRNEVVVLLVDVWATKLAHYQQVLVEYDELNAPTTAVIVPWSSCDPETDDCAEELREDLRRALPNNTARGDVVFRTAVPTWERFRAELEEVLAEVQGRIFHYGKVTRRAGGTHVVDRPVLSPTTGGSL